MDNRVAFCAGLLLLLSLLTSARSQSCGGQNCFISSRNETEPFSSAEVAVDVARCHIACLELQEDLQEIIANDTTIWPSPAMSILEMLSPDIYQEVVACRSGCSIRARDPTVTRRECRSQCDRQPIASCRTGCRLYGDLPALSQTPATLPQTPADPPMLLPLDDTIDAGIFNIIYSIPERNTQNFVNVTAFIFKVEIDMSTRYVFQSSLDDALELGYFACEEVNVSFAAVNGHGASEYSPLWPAQCVHGELRLPSQPRFIRGASIREDLREGFLGRARAMINVTWERPAGYEFLTHYIIMLSSFSSICLGNSGGPSEFIVDREATSFVIVADNPGGPPTFIGRSNVTVDRGCNYIITIQSQPSLPDDFTFTRVRTSQVTEPPAPTVGLHCQRAINETTGSIKLLANWTLTSTSPDVLRFQLEAIEFHFALVSLVKFNEETNTTELIRRVGLGTRISVNDSGVGEFRSQDLIPQTDTNLRYELMFQSSRRQNLFWRRTPFPDERCLVDASPLPPTIIPQENITIHRFEFSASLNHLFLNISWAPPAVTYGDIVEYEVRVTRDNVTGEDTSNQALQPHFETTNDSTTLVIETDEFFTEGEIQCLYAQVRSRNMFAVSQWSDPVALCPLTLSLTPSLTPSPSPTRSTPLASAMSTKQEKGLPVYIYMMIVAAVVAGIILIGILLVAILLCRMCYTRAQIQNMFKENVDDIFRGNRHPSIQWPSIFKVVAATVRQDEWEIPVANVIVEDELGEGYFGKVFKGIVKGPIPSSRAVKNSICIPVAIKFLKDNASGAERENFLKEMETVKEIAQSGNSHIVNLIGCITTREPLCLVMEYLKFGDLLSYLHTIRRIVVQRNHERRLAYKTAGNLDLGGEVQPYDVILLDVDSPYAELGNVEPVNLISFAYQISLGMQYLASIGVVHRDLACRNILVGEDKKLKISDFGMSRVGSEYVLSTNGRLPWKWMAIESIEDGMFTTASDVWAYGITLWEIATLGEFPYPDIPTGGLLVYLKKGLRLECPDNCSKEIYEIMLDCWNENPANRPTFTQLRAKFDAMLLESNNYIQFSSVDSVASSYGRTSPLGTEISDSETDREPPDGYDHLPSLEEIDEITTECPRRGPPNAVNPYVHTPTRIPYDAHFDLSRVNVEQPICEVEEPAYDHLEEEEETDN